MSDFNLDSSVIESCFEEAEKGLKKGEVPVGCLFVLSEEGKTKIIAQAHNCTNEFKSALKHAEVQCFDQIIEKFSSEYRNILKKTLVVLTLEPCIMCCRLLRKMQVKAVLFGASNDRFGGAGSVLNIHSDPRIRDPPLLCVSNFLNNERSINLLQLFYDQTNENAPKNKI